MRDTRRAIYLAPLNGGREPAALVVLKLPSGKAILREEGKISQGSLSLRVLSSVLTMAVMTFEFPNPSTLMLGPRS